MRIRSLLTLLCSLTLGGCGSSGAGAGSGPTPTSPESAALVLRGRVIDGTGARPMEDGVVVVSGERVACVGRARDCKVPRGARVLDAEGGTILPGLIDLHVHPRPHYLPWFLAAGVTTIRDANNSLAQIESNLKVAHRPRILWSGPMLDGPKTIARHFGEEGVRRPTAKDLSHAFTLEVTTPEEARAAVDTLAARGASQIKLYEQIPLAVYQAAAQRARERHLPVMTDLGMQNTRGLSGAEVDALQAIEAGVRSIEHASGYALAYRRLGGDPNRLPYDSLLIDSLARGTVRGGTAVVPTLSPFYYWSDSVTDVSDLPIGEHWAQFPQDLREFFEQGAARVTPASQEAGRRAYLLASAVLRRVRELGGVIGAGSDTPAGVYNIPGGGIHRELELLVREGMPPMEAIHAATGGAARILGRSDLGTIRRGAVADLVVVAGNPAVEIRATRRIRAVVQAGRPLPMDSLIPRSAIAEEPAAH